jgi:hypothetical protein
MDTPPDNESKVLDLTKTITLEEPPRSFRYLAVPDDIRPTALNSEAILGLCRIDGGDLVAELNEELRDLNMACLTLNKKGSITIKLTLDPAGQAQVEIDYDITVKAPKAKRHPSLLYMSSSGQLLSRHPDQMEMDLRTVPTPDRQPLRVVTPPEKQTDLK